MLSDSPIFLIINMDQDDCNLGLEIAILGNLDVSPVVFLQFSQAWPQLHNEKLQSRRVSRPAPLRPPSSSVWHPCDTRPKPNSKRTYVLKSPSHKCGGRPGQSCQLVASNFNDFNVSTTDAAICGPGGMTHSFDLPGNQPIQGAPTGICLEFLGFRRAPHQEQPNPWCFVLFVSSRRRHKFLCTKFPALVI